MTAPSTVTPVWTTELDILLAAKAHCAAAAIATLEIDLALVEELHWNPKQKGER
jgi:hypothetical protein